MLEGVRDMLIAVLAGFAAVWLGVLVAAALAAAVTRLNHQV
jgi:hypothetical protein